MRTPHWAGDPPPGNLSRDRLWGRRWEEAVDRGQGPSGSLCPSQKAARQLHGTRTPGPLRAGAVLLPEPLIPAGGLQLLY